MKWEVVVPKEGPVELVSEPIDSMDHAIQVAMEHPGAFVRAVNAPVHTIGPCAYCGSSMTREGSYWLSKDGSILDFCSPRHREQYEGSGLG